MPKLKENTEYRGKKPLSQFHMISDSMRSDFGKEKKIKKENDDYDYELIV